MYVIFIITSYDSYIPNALEWAVRLNLINPHIFKTNPQIRLHDRMSTILLIIICLI